MSKRRARKKKIDPNLLIEDNLSIFQAMGDEIKRRVSDPAEVKNLSRQDLIAYKNDALMRIDQAISMAQKVAEFRKASGEDELDEKQTDIKDRAIKEWLDKQRGAGLIKE